MTLTKLELYVDILKNLAQNGSLKISNDASETNLNKENKKHLDFLLAQSLVEERKVSKLHLVYSITPRGLSVLKYFNALNQEFPITEET